MDFLWPIFFYVIMQRNPLPPPPVIVHHPIETGSFTIEKVDSVNHPTIKLTEPKPVQETPKLGKPVVDSKPKSIKVGAKPFVSQKPANVPLCVYGTYQKICWDGISYAWLIAHNIPKAEYPKTEEEFVNLKASVEAQ